MPRVYSYPARYACDTLILSWRCSPQSDSFISHRILKPTGEGDKVRVLAWRRAKWGASGPFGVPTMTLDRALDYVASNPFFWIHA
jgi:hypothetical protein